MPTDDSENEAKTRKSVILCCENCHWWHPTPDIHPVLGLCQYRPREAFVTDTKFRCENHREKENAE